MAHRQGLLRLEELRVLVVAGSFAAFGGDVIEHYRNVAKVELTAFDSAVTDGERQRGFERL